MVNEWEPQIEQRDKIIAKLQADNKKTIAQWQDNANQQAKQFDDKIKACRNGYDALLNEITNLNSKSDRVLDYMAQLRQQFDQEHVGSGLPPDARQIISRVGRGFGPPGAVVLAVL